MQASQLLSEKPTSDAHPSNDCAPGGVFMSLHRMLMGAFMIATHMVFGCCVVGAPSLCARGAPQPFCVRRVP
jgi:hypothetical protein